MGRGKRKEHPPPYSHYLNGAVARMKPTPLSAQGGTQIDLALSSPILGITFLATKVFIQWGLAERCLPEGDSFEYKITALGRNRRRK